MQKLCQCGEYMALKLRTVIYAERVEIDNVPIFTCEDCNKSEVIPEVKSELKGLINELGDQPDKQNYLFNECNEWANLLVEYKLTYKNSQSAELQLQRLIEQRTNELLDLFLLAQSLGDQQWLDSIHKKLTQLGKQITMG